MDGGEGEARYGELLRAVREEGGRRGDVERSGDFETPGAALDGLFRGFFGEVSFFLNLVSSGGRVRCVCEGAGFMHMHIYIYVYVCNVRVYI